MLFKTTKLCRKPKGTFMNTVAQLGGGGYCKYIDRVRLKTPLKNFKQTTSHFLCKFPTTKWVTETKQKFP